jgi:prophage antirepressor-like protein
MAHKYIDFTNMIINYDDSQIYIVIADDNELWFNANDSAKLLNYNNQKRAIKMNIQPKNKKHLYEITNNYKLLYKNVQGHTLFINEKGLNELILKSTKKEALEIQEWISNDVMPKIKKDGVYEISKKLKTELTEINQKYDNIKKENIKNRKRLKELENNQKKIKYLKAPAVYIIRPNPNSEINMNKFGRTNDFNVRFSNYNTTVPDDVQVVDVIPVKDPLGVELCVRGMLNKFKYRGRKEYFECSYKKIFETIQICVKNMEQRDITIEKKILSRDKNDINEDDINEINKEELLIFKFENDNNEQIGGFFDDDTLTKNNIMINKEKTLKYVFKTLLLLI